MEIPMDKKMCFVNSLTFQFEITARIFYGIAKDLFKEDVKNKITLEEFLVLEALVCYPHLNINTLAKTLVREKLCVEKIITKLIKKKFLKEINNNGTEIQVKYYELTKAGDKVYQDCAPKNDKMLAVIAKFISENELLAFTKTLLKIRNILISLGYVSY